MAEEVRAGGAGLVGASQQLHVGLLQGTAAFFAVAVRAGTHQILPLVLSPVVTWDNVIHGQVPGLTATVLASVAIPPEDLSLGELHPGARPPDHIAQLDYRRAQEGGGRSADDPSAILQDLGLAHHHQGDGPLDVADMQRFVV